MTSTPTIVSISHSSTEQEHWKSLSSDVVSSAANFRQALSIASQQYGSRVLQTFMRDRITHVLLGTFVSTFIYSALVVRAIRGSDISGGFVPAIPVTVAIALSLASSILLVYFIHHISGSIQASEIVNVIADDMATAIPRLDPSQTGDPFHDRSGSALRRERGQMDVAISSSG